jgi:hypothetical protein
MYIKEAMKLQRFMRLGVSSIEDCDGGPSLTMTLALLSWHLVGPEPYPSRIVASTSGVTLSLPFLSRYASRTALIFQLWEA